MKNKQRIRAFLLLTALAAALAASSLPALASSSAVTLNSSPVAESMELETFRSVPVSGYFKCLDPEGDSVVYSVVKDPVKGSVTIDTDTFVYTPADGKKGRDSFTYVATDSAGNVSNPATVTINIKKQRSQVVYSDMTGSPQAYAAAVMAERGIFVGERVGGEYLFRPDAPVTRGEFLVMCMKLTGAEPLEGITRTGFSDDGDIPLWQKPYVTTALMDDLITGTPGSDGRIVFSAASPVTFAEAGVMLSNALAITDVAVEDSGELPVWAVQAAANLSSCDIVKDRSAALSPSTLTRADAAGMLLRACELLDRREGDGLLGWAK